MNRGQILARGIAESQAHFAHFLDGFTDETRTRQAPSLPNHVAWSLGHCALTMYRAAERIDGHPLPHAHFLFDARCGDALHYGTESVSFRSQPLDDPAIYPTLARGVIIFDSACDRLAACAGIASDARLAEFTRWGSTDLSLESLLWRMVFHNGIHCGQISDLRRTLGLGSIFR